MSLADTPRKAGPFNGNDVTTAFPFEFKVFSDEDIELIHLDADGVETTLVLDSDYSVALNADQDNDPGGTITYPLSGSPLPTGERLVAIGATAYTQPAAITNLGNFQPRVHENALDRNAVLVQQLRELLQRALMVSAFDDAPTALVNATERLGKVLGFNATTGQPEVSTFTMAEVVAALAALAAALSDIETLQDETSRALLFPSGESASDLPVQASRLGRMLGFNEATGQPEISSFTLTQVASAIAAIYTAAAGPLDALSFLQGGTGAVSRSPQEKLRDIAVDGNDFALAMNGSTNDTAKLQQIVDYCVNNRSRRAVLPPGNSKINTLKIQPTAGGFATLDLGGAAGGFLGNTTLVHDTAETTNPAINVQSSRSVRLYDFKVLGNNVAPETLANTVHTGSYNVANDASWLTGGISEGRYNAYCGLLYDGLAGTDPGEGSNYTFGGPGAGDRGYGAGTSSKGFVERMRIQQFAVAVGIHISQNDSGTEDFVFRDTTINSCKYAFALTGSQQRNIQIDNVNINTVWCAFDGVTWGVRSGPPMTIKNSIFGHIYRLFQLHQAIGVGSVENNYCESVSSFGFVGETGSSARMPFSSRSNNYSFVGGRGSVTAGQKDVVAKHYMPTKHDGDAINAMYGHLVYPGNGSMVMFDNVGFNSEQNGTGERKGFQIFTPQALEHLISCRGAFQRSFSTDNKWLDDEVCVTSLPSKAYIARNTRRIARLSDRTLYKLTGGIAGTVTTSVTGLTYVDEDTLTGTESAVSKRFYLGARLYVRLKMPVRPGVADEVAIFPAALITAWNPVSGDFTAKILGYPVDTTYNPANLDIYIPQFINGTVATGDTNSGTNTILNVTNPSNFVVDDWIRTSASSSPRRITNIAGTTVTLDINSATTTVAAQLYSVPLTAL